MRDKRRQSVVSTILAARKNFPQGSPGYSAMTQQMKMNGYIPPEGEDADEVTNLSSDFESVADSAAEHAVSVGMRNTLESQERSQKLNRILQSLPVLASSNDVEAAMDFYYRVHCEATSSDPQLPFQAAIDK